MILNQQPEAAEPPVTDLHWQSEVQKLKFFLLNRGLFLINRHEKAGGLDDSGSNNLEVKQIWLKSAPIVF